MDQYLIKKSSFFAEEIPEENKALRVAAPMSTVAGMLPPTLEWPSNVVNMVSGSPWPIMCMQAVFSVVLDMNK